MSGAVTSFGEMDESSLYVMRRHSDLADIYGGEQRSCNLPGNTCSAI